MTRRGAAQVRRDGTGPSVSREPERHAPERWEPEQWIDEGVVGAARDAVDRAERGGPRDRGRSRATSLESSAEPRVEPGTKRRVRLPGEVVDELRDAVGPVRGARLTERLEQARQAYLRERFADARRILAPLAAEAPGVAAVRELYGLTLYRLGQWKRAIAELEAFGAATGSLDQHAVLADCHRAVRHWRRVDELWEELRAVSPSAELVAEGRIVAAGALADRDELVTAIRLLEQSPAPRGRPKPHHVRVWYALADLYERAGDLPRARSLFERVLAHDPELGAVADRVRRLR